MDNKQSKKRATEQKYLLEVIRCLRYLDRQGIVLKPKMGATTLPNYCASSVQTTKTFYITSKGKLATNVDIIMFKIRFCISWLF